MPSNAPQEALDRIAALPRLHLFPDAAEPIEVVTVVDIEAILAEVTPEAGRPAAIDRDALLAAIAEAIDENYDEENYRPVYTEEGKIIDSAAARAVLTLVRPVAGVTLTPEEAALARRAVLFVAQKSQEGPELYALAARLEAAS